MDKIPAMIARVDQAIAEGDYVLAAALINQVYARYDQLAAGHTVERVAVDRYFLTSTTASLMKTKWGRNIRPSKLPSGMPSGSFRNYWRQMQKKYGAVKIGTLK